MDHDSTVRTHSCKSLSLLISTRLLRDYLLIFPNSTHVIIQAIKLWFFPSSSDVSFSPEMTLGGVDQIDGDDVAA